MSVQKVKRNTRLRKLDWRILYLRWITDKNNILYYIVGAHPPFAVLNGFIQKLWGRIRINKLAILKMGLSWCYLISRLGIMKLDKVVFIALTSHLLSKHVVWTWNSPWRNYICPYLDQSALARFQILDFKSSKYD